MNDEIYMQRCIQLAVMGLGNVSPNPMVGCVIVHDHQVIGEGFHQKFGGHHAEVNAINQVLERYGDRAPQLLKNATAYVSLEPCSHFGKTPPCADLLVRYELKRVVIGNIDPFPSVSGKGIEKLKASGISVATGILADECAFVNRRFFTRINRQRPYIILKWAETADGFFAAAGPVQQWISGSLSKQLSQTWRGEEDAILVGKNTVLIDNPKLTNRSGKGKNPIRIIIDKDLSVPTDYNVFDDNAKTVIFNEVKTEVVKNIHYVQMEDMQFYLPQKIAFQLYLMDIQSVIIEGGINILEQFISGGLWDEARIFRSETIWGDGQKAPQFLGTISSKVELETDELTIYTPHKP